MRNCRIAVRAVVANAAIEQWRIVELAMHARDDRLQAFTLLPALPKLRALSCCTQPYDISSSPSLHVLRLRYVLR